MSETERELGHPAAILEGVEPWDPPRPATGGDQIDVFVSYAGEDRVVARLLASDLRALGWSVWIDDRIDVGTEFDIAIERALDRAFCVMVIWSHASVASTWVRAEAAAADDQGKLVPVRLSSEVTAPLRFRQLSTPTLTNGDLPSTEGLLAGLGRLTGRSPGGLDVPEARGSTGRTSGARRITPGRWRISFRLVRAKGVLDIDLRPVGTFTSKGSWFITRSTAAGRWTYDLSAEVLQMDGTVTGSDGMETQRVEIVEWLDDDIATCRLSGRKAQIERRSPIFE